MADPTFASHASLSTACVCLKEDQEGICANKHPNAAIPEQMSFRQKTGLWKHSSKINFKQLRTLFP